MFLVECQLSLDVICCEDRIVNSDWCVLIRPGSKVCRSVTVFRISQQCC